MENFDAQFAKFVDVVNDVVHNHYNAKFISLIPPKIEIEKGRRYIKLVSADQQSFCSQRSVYCFVDTINGDILMAATWRAPCKNGARGNIFDADFGRSAIGPYGAKYKGQK